MTWQTSVRGLEAATNLFNLSFGLFLVFLGRILGGMYLLNNIVHEALNARCRRSVLINFLWMLPFLFFVLISLVTMEGFAVNPETMEVFMERVNIFTTCWPCRCCSSLYWPVLAL